MYLRVSGWFLCVSRCTRLDTFGYGYDTTWPVANTNVSPHVTRDTYPPKDTLVNTYRIQSRYTDTGADNTYPACIRSLIQSREAARRWRLAGGPGAASGAAGAFLGGFLAFPLAGDASGNGTIADAPVRRHLPSAPNR